MVSAYRLVPFLPTSSSCPHGERNDFPWRESSSPVRGGPLVTQNGILLEAASSAIVVMIIVQE